MKVENEELKKRKSKMVQQMKDESQTKNLQKEIEELETTISTQDKERDDLEE